MTHKWEASPFKNPIARAQGLGSLKSGFDHWWMQRITAIANLLLMVWAVWSVLTLVGADYTTFVTWLATPCNAILLSIFIISVCTHAALGLQVVIEDYVHTEITKVLSLIALRIGFISLAIAALFSILKIAI